MKLSILVAFAALCVMVVLADPAPEPGKPNKPVHQGTKPRPHRHRREPEPQPAAAPEPGKPNHPVHHPPQPKPNKRH